MTRPRALELQFLPAALEIEETPPLPVARVMLGAIVVFFFLALAWMWVGRVDIVGVAPGRVVPTGRTKTVQPLESAVITRIHVSEGQHVEAGEVLIELDPTTAGADKARLGEAQRSRELDRLRLTRLLDTIRGAAVPDGTPFATLESHVPPARLANAETRLLQQLAEYRAAIAGLDQDRREKRSARAAVAARITQLEGTLPLITEEADAHRKLMITGVVPRVKWLAVERERNWCAAGAGGAARAVSGAERGPRVLKRAAEGDGRAIPEPLDGGARGDRDAARGG